MKKRPGRHEQAGQPQSRGISGGNIRNSHRFPVFPADCKASYSRLSYVWLIVSQMCFGKKRCRSSPWALSGAYRFRCGVDSGFWSKMMLDCPVAVHVGHRMPTLTAAWAWHARRIGKRRKGFRPEWVRDANLAPARSGDVSVSTAGAEPGRYDWLAIACWHLSASWRLSASRRLRPSGAGPLLVGGGLIADSGELTTDCWCLVADD